MLGDVDFGTSFAWGFAWGGFAWVCSEGARFDGISWKYFGISWAFYGIFLDFLGIFFLEKCTGFFKRHIPLDRMNLF